MKVVLCIIILFVNMISPSLQNHKKFDNIHEILDKLIKQTDEKETKLNMEINNSEKPQSEIIYFKSSTKPNISRELEISKDSTGDNIKYVKNLTREGETIISEEIIFEMENGKDAQQLQKADFEESLRSGKHYQDFWNNDVLPENDLSSYLPKTQKEPDLLSRYPEILASSEMTKSDSKGTGAIASGMIREILQNKNKRIINPGNKPEFLLQNTDSNFNLENDVDNRAAKQMNNKFIDFFGSQSNLLNTMALGFPPPIYPLVPQPVVRTVIHHSRPMVPLQQWPLGPQCCTSFP